MPIAVTSVAATTAVDLRPAREHLLAGLHAVDFFVVCGREHLRRVRFDTGFAQGIEVAGVSLLDVGLVHHARERESCDGRGR